MKFSRIQFSEVIESIFCIEVRNYKKFKTGGKFGVRTSNLEVKWPSTPDFDSWIHTDKPSFFRLKLPTGTETDKMRILFFDFRSVDSGLRKIEFCPFSLGQFFFRWKTRATDSERLRSPREALHSPPESAGKRRIYKEHFFSGSNRWVIIGQKV